MESSVQTFDQCYSHFTRNTQKSIKFRQPFVMLLQSASAVIQKRAKWSCTQMACACMHKCYECEELQPLAWIMVSESTVNWEPTNFLEAIWKLGFEDTGITESQTQIMQLPSAYHISEWSGFEAQRKIGDKATRWDTFIEAKENFSLKNWYHTHKVHGCVKSTFFSSQLLLASFFVLLDFHQAALYCIDISFKNIAF